MQLQKDVILQLSKVNEKQMINMIYSLAPKSFLFIVSRRKLPYNQSYVAKKIKQSADKLKEQEEAFNQSRKRNKEQKSKQGALQEESKE